jgi:hypothetical protein
MTWRPQTGPQTAFVTSPVFEVIYGGARIAGTEAAPMLAVFDARRDFIRTVPAL